MPLAKTLEGYTYCRIHIFQQEVNDSSTKVSFFKYLWWQDKSDDGHEQAWELFAIQDEVKDLLESGDLGFGIAFLKIRLQGRVVRGLPR